MRPILLKIPALPLLIACLLVAVIAVVRDVGPWKWKGKKPVFPMTSVWALAGAAALAKFIGKWGGDGDVLANLRAGFVPTHHRESRVVENVLEIADLRAAKRYDDERGSDAHIALDAALLDERGFHPRRPKARDRNVGRPV